MAAPRRPSALKHGLTSRAIRADWSVDVVRLAEALIGAAPREPQLLEAAHEAAEAILYLRRVQQCRMLVLEDGALRRASPTDAEKAVALKLSEAVRRAKQSECDALRDELRVAHDATWNVDIETAATFSLGRELGERAAELRRLSEYERRANSLRRNALRRLDFERIEAERRRVADVAGRHGEPRPGVA
jgi:hypothetical protein